MCQQAAITRPQVFICTRHMMASPMMSMTISRLTREVCALWQAPHPWPLITSVIAIVPWSPTTTRQTALLGAARAKGCVTCTEFVQWASASQCGLPLQALLPSVGSGDTSAACFNHRRGTVRCSTGQHSATLTPKPHTQRLCWPKAATQSRSSVSALCLRHFNRCTLERQCTL
jgi:hypothetical protein